MLDFSARFNPWAKVRWEILAVASGCGQDVRELDAAGALGRRSGFGRWFTPIRTRPCRAPTTPSARQATFHPGGMNAASSCGTTSYVNQPLGLPTAPGARTVMMMMSLHLIRISIAWTSNEGLTRGTADIGTTRCVSCVDNSAPANDGRVIPDHRSLRWSWHLGHQVVVLWVICAEASGSPQRVHGNPARA